MNKNLLSFDKKIAYTHGNKFYVGEEVTHQDKSGALKAIILSFDWSDTHEGEVKALTTEGSAHLDFLEKI